MLGHAHFDSIKRSAKYYNVQLSGTVQTCVACALAKIRQKNINKVTSFKSFHPGARRIYIVISSSMRPSYGGAKYWILIVDDYSRYCWSNYVINKSG
jgi:hypothetical protein